MHLALLCLGGSQVDLFAVFLNVAGHLRLQAGAALAVASQSWRLQAGAEHIMVWLGKGTMQQSPMCCCNASAP